MLFRSRVYDKAVAQADEDVQKAVKEVEAELGDEGRILFKKFLTSVFYAQCIKL